MSITTIYSLRVCGGVISRCRYNNLNCSYHRLSSHRRFPPSHNSIDVDVHMNFLSIRHKHSQSSRTWLERQQKDIYTRKAQDENLPSRSSFKLKQINEHHYPSLVYKHEKKRKGKQNRLSQPDHYPSLFYKQERKRGRELSNKQKRLIQPDMLVLDLGACPGGWSLYASTILKPKLGGSLIAVDLLPLDETLQSQHSDVYARIKHNLQSNFQFIQGDFTDRHTRLQIEEAFTNIHVSNTTRKDIIEDDKHDHRKPYLIISDMAANFSGDTLTDALRTLNLCEQALAFSCGAECFDETYSAKDGRSGVLNRGGAFLCKYFKCGKENEEDLFDAAKRSFRSVHTIKPKASRKESSEQYLLALDYK